MSNKFKDFFKNKEESKSLGKLKDLFKKKESKEEKSKDKKVNLEKLKEGALLLTAITLIGVGYVNFSNNPQKIEKTVETYADSTNSLGDVELVNSEAALVDNSKEENKTGLVENDEASQTSSSNDSNESYFSTLRMNRDNVYSEKLETYQKIVDSPTISSEQKSIAIQEIEKINKSKSAIAVAEELIKAKDFEDVVIYENDGTVSVIVRISALSLEQVAQIQNIVSRELGVDNKNISISNK